MINYAKKAFAAIALMLVATAAQAAVKFTMSELNISAGETKEVTVFMENDEAVWNFQFKLELPAGITASDFAKADRAAKYSLVPTYKKDTNTWSVFALSPNSSTTIAAGKGAVLTFNATASADLATTAEIVLSGVKATDTKNESMPEVTAENGEVNKMQAGIELIASTDSIRLIGGGKTADVEISMKNNVALWGLQGNIILPEGMTIEGEISLTNRLPEYNLSVKQTGQNYAIVAGNFDATATIKGTSGAIMKFTVKADETVQNGSTIRLVDFSSDLDGETVKFNNVSIKVITDDPNEEAYKVLCDSIANVQKLLDDAVKLAAIVAPDVDVKADSASVQTKINDFQVAADAAYVAGILKEGNEPFNKVANPVSALKEEIAKLLTDAIAKQNELTGINEVKAGKEAQTIYNIGGQRVQKPVKGLNIINGKKVLK